MTIKMILFFVIIFLLEVHCAHGMQGIMHITGSALAASGGALFLQGVYRHNQIFIPRLRDPHNGVHIPLSLRIHDWIEKAAVPIVGGSVAFGIGMILMVYGKIHKKV